MSRQRLLIAVLLGVLPVLVLGQPPTPPAGKPPASPFKDEELKADTPEQKDINDFRKMFSGSEDQPQGNRRKEVMERIGKFLIYRLTWSDIQEGRSPVSMRDVLIGTSPGAMDGIFSPLPLRSQAATDDPQALQQRERQRQFLQEFKPFVLTYLRQVLENKALIARMNAARALHRIAELRQTDVADDCLKIIESPHENDAVRYWAVQSLGELFAVPPQAKDAKPVKDQKPMDVEACALSVFKWLDRLCKTPAEALSQMSPGEVDAIRYLRRAGMRSLSHLHRGLIVDTKERREGPFAAMLVAIMNSPEGVISPAPSLPERIEAALALCQLYPKASPSYQADQALYQVAGFIALLNAEANTDADRNAHPWKVYATNLKNSLDGLKPELQPAASPAAAFHAKLMGQVDPSLKNMFNKDDQPQAAQDLNRWVRDPSNAPKATDLYNPPLN